MTAIQELLPALGLGLPGGASLQGGTATSTVAISGPVDRLVVSGPLRLADVTVSGFDLGAKLKTVAALAGINTGRDTRIQSLNCTLRVAPEGTSASDVNAAIIGLGTLSGAGSVAANNAVDFRMTAQLTRGGGLLGALLKRSGVGQLDTVPFRITGTTSDPHFLPDVGAIMTTNRQPSAQQQQPRTPIGGLLNQLLRKKQ
jgi:AsmA protein